MYQPIGQKLRKERSLKKSEIWSTYDGHIGKMAKLTLTFE